MSGLIDLAETGVIEPGGSVVFLHTGGIPELYTRSARDLAA